MNGYGANFHKKKTASLQIGGGEVSEHYSLCLDNRRSPRFNTDSDWTVNSISRVARRDLEGHARDRAGSSRWRVPMQPGLFKPGRAYSFLYPRHNYQQLPEKTELRRIEVVSIRDIHQDPLDPTTLPLNPLLKRGRWLVTGRDLDKDDERSFYVESMTNVRCLNDDELEPLQGVGYVVVEQTHVTFRAQHLNEALAFRSGRQRGAICGVLATRPRQLPPVSILDQPLTEQEYHFES